MIVAYGSDLHLEFSLQKGFDYKSWDKDADVLLLAGDILPVTWYKKAINTNSGDYETAQKIVEYFKHLNQSYERIFYVMGNHEHYGGTFNDTYNDIQAFLDYHKLDNVILLEDEAYEYKDVVFYGATMWTDTSRNPSLEWFIRQSMNDYKLIKYRHGDNYSKLHNRDTTHKHLESINLLKRFTSLKLLDKFVLITHHAPSYKSIPVIYQTSKLNDAYYSHVLEKMFMENKFECNPTYLCHGHIHSKIDYNLNGINVVANPRGYEGYESTADNYEYELFVI